MASSAEQPKATSYKTKHIHFFGRTTPIILQNDNGPCPLLAICNVLSLKNGLNLSADATAVLQERLLSLVADRLLDSNSNVNNEDEGYIENRLQKIADAIDLLPRLTTGIDVNIKFRRIADFEFTRECAIFELLDIPLYHGWIVDPQDHDTANAIGSKSYNTLMSELVALETVASENNQKQSSSHSIDFESANSNGQNLRKGDFEEAAELSRTLELSESEIPDSNGQNLTVGSNVSAHVDESEPLDGKINEEPSISDDQGNISDQLNSEENGEKLCKEMSAKTLVDLSVKSENNEAEEIKNLDSSSERRNNSDETVTSNAEDSKNRFDISSQDEITPKQGEVIRNFLKNSASQLTVYGLFCLQEGLEDRELCFFFRNNHFNTMFKVNGDTQFMTSDFKEFKIEDNHAITSIWDEIDDLNKTSLENLPNIDGPDSLATCKSDRELAITLQQDDREVQRNSRQQNQPHGFMNCSPAEKIAGEDKTFQEDHLKSTDQILHFITQLTDEKDKVVLDEVAVDATDAIVDFVGENNPNRIENSRIIVDFNGIKKLVAMIEAKTSWDRVPELNLLSHLVINVVISHFFTRQGALEVIERATPLVADLNIDSKALFDKALHRLKLYEVNSFSHHK